MEELLEKLRALDSLDDIAGLADQISTAYNDFSTGAEASGAEKDKTIADQAAEIQRLQAENYKLLTATAQAEDEDTEKKDTDPDDPNQDDDGETIENIEDVIEKD